MKTKLPNTVHIISGEDGRYYTETDTQAAIIEAYREGVEDAALKISAMKNCHPSYIIPVVRKLKETL